MAVTVTTNDGYDQYENATGWHVDDDRQLHIFKKDGAAGASTSLGSYANGAWAAVNVTEEVKIG